MERLEALNALCIKAGKLIMKSDTKNKYIKPSFMIL